MNDSFLDDTHYARLVMMKCKFKKCIGYWVILIIALMPNLIYAINDNERTELSMLLKEIDVIVSMVPDIERTADKHSRIQFDYEALRNDIAEIKQGISDYVKTSRRDPRKLQVIDGEYRQ